MHFYTKYYTNPKKFWGFSGVKLRKYNALHHKRCRAFFLISFNLKCRFECIWKTFVKILEKALLFIEWNLSNRLINWNLFKRFYLCLLRNTSVFRFCLPIQFYIFYLKLLTPYSYPLVS